MAERAARQASEPAAPVLCSVEEAAAILGIGRTFMFRLVATGAIDSVKIGKRRKIPRTAIDAYVQRLLIEQSSAASPNRRNNPD